MLETFCNEFKLTSRENIVEDADFFENIPIELFRLISEFGGATFENGIYRIHSFRDSLKWQIKVQQFFPNISRLYPFGFDWMGRQFCLNNSLDIITMFDPAVLEYFELKQHLLDFHNHTLCDDLLLPNFFNTIRNHYQIDNINFNECLGFKIPLFLGGKDTVENYENQDIDVYWHFASELFKKTKDLPDGTKINKVKIE